VIEFNARIIMTMSWDTLLSPVRIRDLIKGTTSKNSDHRTPFQQDFDRLLFSTPVRRLQDKAQVFPLEPNDAVRTRLTHSMEVSTVARGIVLKVASLLGSQHPFSKRERDIHDIALAAGLVHDLGNPPFGHFGEDAIREWFITENGLGKKALASLDSCPQMRDDIAVHEGNARTIRLLCSLQILADRNGLNLTAATIAATMKYVAPSHLLSKAEVDHTRSKPGYLWSEAPVVTRVREATGTAETRHPIAFIVEAADDCVYSLCDLEDAVRKGILSWDELCGVLCDQICDQKEKDEAKRAERDKFEKWLQSFASVIDDRFSGSGLSPGMRARDDARALWLRTQGQGLIITQAAASFVARYDDIMNGTFKGELVADREYAPDAARLVKCCKKAAQRHVYPVRPNLELELKGRRVIHDLMDLLWLGLKDYQGEAPKAKSVAGKTWYLLSENYRTVFEADWATSVTDAEVRKVDACVLRQYLRLLLLTDYVGGMTDTFACTLHRSLTNG